VVRDGRGDEAEAELHGNIAAFDAGTQTFVIRDVRVDASHVTPRNCPATGLADGLFVEVEGTLSSTTVIATRVQCEGEPPGATVEREGTVASVDAGARRFVLATQPGGATVNVSWSDLTFFRGVAPDTLAGKRVEVEACSAATVRSPPAR
jgi:hypothetical protein